MGTHLTFWEQYMPSISRTESGFERLELYSLSLLF